MATESKIRLQNTLGTLLLRLEHHVVDIVRVITQSEKWPTVFLDLRFPTVDMTPISEGFA